MPQSLPVWARVHRELKRKGVTLMLLWQEYKAAQPDGVMYCTFCDRYCASCGQLDVVVRQDHRAGDNGSVFIRIEFPPRRLTYQDSKIVMSVEHFSNGE